MVDITTLLFRNYFQRPRNGFAGVTSVSSTLHKHWIMFGTFGTSFSRVRFSVAQGGFFWCLPNMPSPAVYIVLHRCCDQFLLCELRPERKFVARIISWISRWIIDFEDIEDPPSKPARSALWRHPNASTIWCRIRTRWKTDRNQSWKSNWKIFDTFRPVKRETYRYRVSQSGGQRGCPDEQQEACKQAVNESGQSCKAVWMAWTE